MGEPRRPDWSGRLDRAWRSVAGKSVSALIVSSPANLKYLCGFSGTQGLLVLTSSARRLILDGRYAQAAARDLASGELGPVSIEPAPGRYDACLQAVVDSLDPASLGFEADTTTVATLAAWQRAMADREFVPMYGVVEALRLLKDAGEIESLRRAAAAVSSVARVLDAWVAEGRTEREVAADIDAALLRAGCAQPAFRTIVASGPNSAHPHARPTDRRLAEGDLVLLDFGGVLDGYCGDLTRMAAIGQVQANAQSLVTAVRAAQEAAIAAVRAGIAASEVDGAARRVLEARGLGEAFLHATGHGLGLEVHEAPRLGRADPDRVEQLEAGMVCTVEPGAYVEGLGGARIEDDVVVTAAGCEVLTDAPRDLLVV